MARTEADHPVHRRAAHHGGRRQGRGRHRRRQHAQARRWRAASCTASARPRWTSTAKYVEKDAALERRFQKVLVDEPSVEATIAILRGLQEKYEVHHGVEITDRRHRRGDELSQPLHHRPLPARQGHRPDRRGRRPIKIEIDSKPEVMDKLDRRIIQLRSSARPSRRRRTRPRKSASA